jgi:hypothetical protein
MMSIASMARLLASEGRITDEELRDLEQFAEIRNRAIHELEPPSEEDAELASRLALGFFERFGTPTETA